jgi:hypothetical protein
MTVQMLALNFKKGKKLSAQMQASLTHFDVADEERATRSLTLKSFFNQGIVDFVVRLASWWATSSSSSSLSI